MTKPSRHIIEDVLKNKATPHDAKIVVKWFATQEGQTYLKGIMDKEHYQNTNDSDDANFNQKEILQKINKIINIQKRRFIFNRIAVVLIPLLLLSTTLWYVNTKVDLFGMAKTQTVTTTNGETLQIVFQDGTRAYINPETTITFPEKFGFNKRTITLNGEAYFDVAKNPNRPFVIQAENSLVKVLGTSFLMTSYKSDKSIKVILDEGSITFTNKNKSKKKLKAGEKLKYNKKTGDVTVSKKHEQHQYNKRKDKFIAFDDDNLETVTKTLHRWYGTSFVVKDSTAYDYSFTTSFKNNSLEEVITELQKLSSLTFTQTEGNNVIIKLKNNN